MGCVVVMEMSSVVSKIISGFKILLVVVYDIMADAT